MSSLWDAILKVTRVNGDPLKNWEEHNANLAEKTNKLNDLHIKTLTYKSSNGTDLTIGLVNDYIFEGGTSFTPEGVEFDANMPTEEIFTMPHKDQINGTVYATKPLFVYGVVIENFGFIFKDGHITEILCDNEEHKKVLQKLTSVDAGASSLGEVALVPNSSPINKTGILFFNTLYDENASCHIALGDCYKTNMKNSESYSDKEMSEKGANSSLIHIDFMIGNETTEVIGLNQNNEEILILKDGEFVL